MLPLPSGTWVLCEFMETLGQLGGGRPYVLSTKDDGLLFKRVENRLDREGDFLLVSNNPAFDSYAYPPEEIREAWRAIGWFSTDWPQTSAEIASTLAALKKSIRG